MLYATDDKGIRGETDCVPTLMPSQYFRSKETVEGKLSTVERRPFFTDRVRVPEFQTTLVPALSDESVKTNA